MNIKLKYERDPALVLGMTLNCTEDSVFKLRLLFVITWITVDFGCRYRQTDILVLLAFGFAYYLTLR